MDMIEVRIHCKFGCFLNMYIIDPLMSVQSYLLFDHDSGGSLWKIENTQIQIILTSCKKRSNKTTILWLLLYPWYFIALFPPNIWTFRLPWDQTSSGEQKKTWCFITYKHVFAIREKATKIKHTSWHLNVGTNELDPLFLVWGSCPCSMLLVEKSQVSLGVGQGFALLVKTW